jgi:hypothetical protein
VIYNVCNAKGCTNAYVQSGVYEEIPVGWLTVRYVVEVKDKAVANRPFDIDADFVEVDIALDGKPGKLKVWKPEAIKQAERDAERLFEPRVRKVRHDAVLCPACAPKLPELAQAVMEDA